MKRTGLSGLSLVLALLLGTLVAPSARAAAGDLPLQSGRFVVSVTWQTATGSGSGTGVALTNDSGYFWFFDAKNIELVVKVLNACASNQRFWVFAGGLTNVSTTIKVTDTQTGAVKTYTNPQNTPFKPIQDTSAFACP